MPCEFFSLVVHKDTQPGVRVMARLRCKSWQCPYCAKENRKQWGKHLRKVLPKITSNWWFITLTAHEHTRTEELSLHNIRSNLDRLMKRVKRVWTNVEYVRVYEKHKTGAFHAHMLVSGLSARVQKFTTPSGVSYYRPTLHGRAVGNLSVRTWYRRTARSMGMGYMVDIQALEGVSRAIGYVIKYLTKAAQDFYVKGLRRIQTSRGIGSPNSRGDGSWQVSARVFRSSMPEGSRLYDADRKLWIPDIYWETHLTYPEPSNTA